MFDFAEVSPVYDAEDRAMATSPPPERLHTKPRPPSSGRRNRHRAEIFDRLCTAALELFAIRGIESTKVSDITDAADVGKGTFFNYFSSKEAIAVQLLERKRPTVEQALREAEAGTATVREAIGRMVRAMAEGPQSSPLLNRGLAKALLAQAPSGPLLMGYAAKTRGTLTDIFRIAQRRGELRNDVGPELLAALFQEAQYGCWFKWCLHPTGDLADAYEALLDRFWSTTAAISEAKTSRRGLAGAEPHTPDAEPTKR